MTHGDAKPGLVGQALHFALPQTAPCGVAAAPFSGDEQLLLVRVELFVQALATIC